MATLGRCCRPEILVDRLPVHLQLSRDGFFAQPFLRQRMDLLESLAHGRPCLLSGDFPVLAQPRQPVLRRTGCRETLHRRGVALQDASRDVSQVPQEVKAVRHLDGLRCPSLRSLGIFPAPIPTHHLGSWMLGQPGGDGVGGSIR